jgi:hypothetical protein
MYKGVIKGVTRAVERVRRYRPPLAETPDVSRNRFLFIGGLHRSGTSIVHRMLREHPAISGFVDTGVPEDEGQHLQSVFAKAYKLGGPGGFAFDVSSHLTEVDELANIASRDQLLREWGAYYDLTRPLLLEKSPPNLVRSRFFQALFPDAAFLFVIRHPVAVALATRKWTRATVTEMLLHWHSAYSIMLADSMHLRQFKIVRYEDLVAWTQSSLDEICDLVGVDHFTPAEQIVDHNLGYFTQWAQGFVRDREAAEQILPPGFGPMQRFGYSFSEPFVGELTE